MTGLFVDRARDWWLGRSERERWLLGVMFGIVALSLVWLLIVRPFAAARTAGHVRLAAATESAGRIAAAAAALKQARASAPPALTVTLPVAVGQAAEANGFTLSRLDVQGSDRATIAIATARPPALFAWLATLERQGIIVDQLTLRTNSDATLAVEGIVRTRGQ